MGRAFLISLSDLALHAGIRAVGSAAPQRPACRIAGGAV